MLESLDDGRCTLCIFEDSSWGEEFRTRSVGVIWSGRLNEDAKDALLELGGGCEGVLGVIGGEGSECK